MPITSHHINSQSGEIEILIRLMNTELYTLHGRLTEVIMATVKDEVTKAVTEDFMTTRLSEVMKHLDPQAIANLAVADAAKLIREKLIDPKR